MALGPGLTGGTALSRDHSVLERAFFAGVLRWFVPLMPGGSTPSRSGNVAAFMLTAPELASPSGVYLDFHRKEAKASPEARDPALARSLLDDSIGLLGLSDSENGFRNQPVTRDVLSGERVGSMWLKAEALPPPS